MMAVPDNSMPPESGVQPRWSAMRWWTPSQLDAMARHIDAGWRAWQIAWGAQPAEVAAVTCVAVDQPATFRGDAWQALGQRGHAAAWLHDPARIEGDVKAAMFGAPPFRATQEAGTVADEAATAAWRDARDRLVRSLFLDAGDPGSPESVHLRRWSGSVWATLPFRDGCAVLLLNAACVQTALPASDSTPVPVVRAASERLTSVTQAMAGRRVQLCAELDGCDIQLGTLQALRVGDVVRLPHPLDKPLRLLGGGEMLCEGWLGRRGGSKAVELIAAAGT